MVSRKNIQERVRKMEEKKERHSIRKFTVGAASVLIGLSFMGMRSQTVSASTEENQQVVATEKTVTNEAANKTVAESTAPQSAEQVTEKIATPQAETIKAPSYSDSKDKVDNINNEVNKDLENVVEEASKVEGVTIVSGDKKPINTTVGNIDKNKEELEKYNQEQINKIKAELEEHYKKLDEYKNDLAAYNKARDEYIQKLKDLGLWKDDEHIDPDSLSQLLVIGKEENATVEAEGLHPNVSQGSGSVLNGMLNHFWEVSDSVSGDFLKVTYSDLLNSSYAGKPISKIEIVFSDFVISNNPYQGNRKPGIYFGNCPTNGFFYAKAEGVTMNLKMYDADGKLITLGENTAYITTGSLNSKGEGNDYVEKAEIINGDGHKGEGVALPESSVTIHKGPNGDILYSDKNNELLYSNKISAADREKAIAIWGKDVVDKYLGWDDSTDRSKEIFGSGLFKVSGNSIKIRFSNKLGSAWATFSTTIPKITFDAEKPEAPTTTITYNPGELVLNKNSSVHIHYVDVNGAVLNGVTDFLPEHGFELNDQMQSHEHLAIGDIYDNQLWDWTSQNYILATDSVHPNATNGVIKDDVQHIYVYLKHNTETVNRDKEVNQTIHYVYEDGTTAAPDHVSIKLVFTQTGIKNLVTGEIVWDSDWKQTQSFVTVVSPTIQGFHTDKPEVGPYDITVDNSNFNKNLDKEDTVVYKANPTETVNRDKEVNQIIHYVYEDGTTAAPDHVSIKLIFTQTGVKDLITGEIVWDSDWKQTQSFVTVVSPTIDGYTADRTEVGPYDITVDNNNFDQNLDKEDTVVYVKNPEQPTQPSEPTTPEDQPTNPTTPEDQPTNPTQPSTPDEQPTNPTTPEDQPTSPIQPSTPIEEPTNPPTLGEEVTAPVLPEEIPSDEDVVTDEETVTPKPQEVTDSEENMPQKLATVSPKAEKALKNLSEESLPETGEGKTNKAGVFGLAIAAVASIFSLAGTKKRKKN